MNDDAFEYVIAKEQGHYKTGVETTAQFYKRATDPSFIVERKRFNKWFNEFPQEEHEEIKKKLSSNRDVYYDIYYEFLLYQLFKCQGFVISIHPQLQGTLKHPDFLIEKDGFKCYVEAKTVKRIVEEENCVQKNKELVYQAINSIDTNGFKIVIKKFSLNTNRTFSTKLIVKEILNKIEEGDKLQLLSFDFEFVNEDCFMSLGLYKMGYKHDLFENRINIIAYEPKYFIGNRNCIFYKGFKEKVVRYGKLDYPYIICINSGQLLTSFDWEDIDNMLVRNMTLNNSKQNEVFFSIHNEYVHQGVSAILLSQDFGCFSKDIDYRFILHPRANLPIDISKFTLAHHNMVNGILVQSKGKSISELVYS